MEQMDQEQLCYATLVRVVMTVAIMTGIAVCQVPSEWCRKQLNGDSVVIPQTWDKLRPFNKVVFVKFWGQAHNQLSGAHATCHQ